MDIIGFSNYWLLAVVIPVFFLLKQSEKLLFTGFKYHPDDIFPVSNARKRYLVYLLENIFKLFETFIVIRILFFIFFAYSIINLSIHFESLTGISKYTAIFVSLFVFSVYASICGFDIKNEIINKNYARIILAPVYWLNVLITPVTEIINEFILFFDRKLFNNFLEQNHNKIGEYFWGDTVVGEAPNEDEIELIDGIVSFKEISAKEVMTPRTDMIAISDEAGFEELIQLINSTRHSRIPLYSNDLDNITGILYAKDLLPLISDNEKALNYNPQKVARKALYIPETKMIKDLLNEFQEKKMHIAIVIDEFGGTAGLITLEDIIEEIVGEIRDELDVEENPVTKIEENKYLVLGKVSIDEINELLDINIPVIEGYDSIAGFILSNAGEFPKEGFTFKIEYLTITVKEIVNKRIKKVLIEKTAAG